jgi:Trypsin-like peptidase domain
MHNPIDSTGWVVRTDSGAPRFAGTCFGLYRPNIMITARHVLTGAPRENVTVTILLDDVEEGVSVENIIAHPSADVAILVLDDAINIFDYFRGIAPLPEMGTDVAAFGYPEDTEPGGAKPTPRYFKGHVQRRYKHRSHLGYEYLAAELSFGAPGGLSGGPVAHTAFPSLAMGVVAENRESSTFLSGHTEVRDGNERYREEVRSMINYAACVMLEPLREWLHEHIRPGLMAFID